MTDVWSLRADSSFTMPPLPDPTGLLGDAPPTVPSAVEPPLAPGMVRVYDGGFVWKSAVEPTVEQLRAALQRVAECIGADGTRCRLGPGGGSTWLAVLGDQYSVALTPADAIRASLERLASAVGSWGPPAHERIDKRDKLVTLMAEAFALAGGDWTRVRPWEAR